MRNIRVKHKNDSKIVLDTGRDEAYKWVRTEESIKAFENIKALGLKEIANGRGDSPVSRFIKLFVEEMEKA